MSVLLTFILFFVNFYLTHQRIKNNCICNEPISQVCQTGKKGYSLFELSVAQPLRVQGAPTNEIYLTLKNNTTTVKILNLYIILLCTYLYHFFAILIRETLTSKVVSIDLFWVLFMPFSYNGV